MEDSVTGSSAAGEEGPESWEEVDVEASVRRLMLSSGKDSNVSCNKQDDVADGSGSVPGSSAQDDLINTVDQFLREAIQNPRERLSVLRMEQEVERFIHDPSREQMEFQQIPTSYLRLAAHRVAQHYSLQSMVSLDNNFLDGSGSRIIIRKTSNIRLPLIRLADIPVNFPTEESGALKVAIKQRPQKGSFDGGSSGDNNPNAHYAQSSSSKSVEERKEEYNKARARIFSSNSSGGKPVNDPRNRDIHHHGSLKTAKTEDRIFLDGGSNLTISRSFSDSSTSTSRLPKSRTEETFGRPKTNNRVAIFRDREVDRNDPDYDRSYDRYMQRFDPGFGFSGGSYTIQPMYVPAVNYNTEFPQFLLNTNLVLFLNTFLGRGFLHPLLLVLGMALLRPCCLRLVQVMSLHALILVSTCIQHSIHVKHLDCHICILLNQFTIPFHSLISSNLMQVLD